MRARLAIAGGLMVLSLLLAPARPRADGTRAADAKDGFQRSERDEKEAFWRMRALLYCDSPLEQEARLRAQFHIVAERQEGQETERRRQLTDLYTTLHEVVDLVSRNEIAEARRLLSVIEKAHRNHDYLLVQAFVDARSGAIGAARDGMRSLLSEPTETRDELQYWAILRELGSGIEERLSRRVLGVVVEIGDEQIPTIVAGFADGTARFFVEAGPGLMGDPEALPVDIAGAARLLVRQGAALREEASPEDNRDFPRPGAVRVVLLTPGGPHTLSVPLAVVEEGPHRLRLLWDATQELLGRLLEVYREN